MEELAAITQLEPADSRRAADTLVAAFTGDPVWGWMFETADDPSGAMRAVMDCLIAGALINGSAWQLGACESVALWVLPGQDELTDQLERDLHAGTAAAGGETAARVDELFEAFETKHPRAESHHYLSMYATHPDMQGRGSGAALMRHALATIDGQNMPAYLESSNPKNDNLYEHFGFESIGAIDVPEGCPVPHAFWRPAR